MTDPDRDSQHRTRHQIDPDRVEVHDASEALDESGMFRIRMPVTSTGEARDGEAFSRDRLRGFRDQIETGDVGVFLDHGRNETTGSRYSALGKIGYWTQPELVEREGATDLEADAVIADPQAMDLDPGPIRNHIAWLKTQAEVGIPLASSVGWSEATGEREVPGDADLLEISIVGIPSDPRTTTANQESAMARAVATASEGFDPEAFVAAYRDAITAEDVKPASPVHVDGEAEATQRNTVEVGDEEIDLTPPEAVQNAATLALAKDDELDSDCGTGAGDESARQIAGDSVTAARIDDIAAYLTSHAEDVTAEGPPSDWSNEEWGDCGNLQYAKWGGTGTGTGLEWAQRTANAVAEAAGEELPYPDRAARNLDDPEFAEGDAVMWSSQDTPVHGRVEGVYEQFSPNEDVTITGDDGEAVYAIYEWDDSLSPPRFQNSPSDPNVAKPQSSLSESGKDLPPATAENFEGDDEANMTDDPDTESADEESADTDRDEQPTLRDMETKMNEMREMVEENTRMTTEIHEEMMGGDDENAGGEDMDDEDGEDEDMEENSADADADADADERTVTLDGEDLTVDEARARIADLRETAADAEPADPETTDRAAEDDTDDTDDSDTFW